MNKRFSIKRMFNRKPVCPMGYGPDCPCLDLRLRVAQMPADAVVVNIDPAQALGSALDEILFGSTSDIGFVPECGLGCGLPRELGNRNCNDCGEAADPTPMVEVPETDAARLTKRMRYTLERMFDKIDMELLAFEMAHASVPAVDSLPESDKDWSAFTPDNDYELIGVPVILESEDYADDDAKFELHAASVLFRGLPYVVLARTSVVDSDGAFGWAYTHLADDFGFGLFSSICNRTLERQGEVKDAELGEQLSFTGV